MTVKPISLVLALSLGVSAAFAVGKTEGTKAFTDGKCTMCHTANVAGLTKENPPKGGDLPTSLAGKSLDFVKNVTLKKQDVNGKPHPVAYAGADLETLAAWLVQITGENLLTKNKCTMCHSVNAIGLTKDKAMGGDLSKVGASQKADWIEGFVAKKINKGDKAHKGNYSGTPEELKALAAYLATLK
ncbi:MAG: cytochrome c [Spirochaetes bacterium]|nr:cytochrome c [Spirochaetota bacterium]